MALFLGGCASSPSGAGATPSLPGEPTPQTPPHVDLSGVGQSIGSFAGGVGGGFTGSITGAALSSFIDSITQSLQNLGHSLGGDAMIATDHAAGNLSQLENQFKDMLHGQVNVPINNLSYEVQDAAQQLNSTATRLQAILDSQQSSLYVDVDVFTAGIQTAALEIKGGFFTGPKDSPRIFYYTFAGMLPELVPKSGGTMTVTGYRLWENAPPKVSLLNAQGALISTVDAQRGSSDNSIAFNIPTGFVQTNSGQTIILQVIPQQRVSSWFSSRTVQLAPLNYPIVIPSDYSMGFRVAAHIAYPIKKKLTETLEAQSFGFDNHSCENGPEVTLTRHWSDLPPGGRIVSFTHQPIFSQVQNNNIAINIVSNTDITASGSMDKASCVNTPFGDVYGHEASWAENVTPTIEYFHPEEHTSDGGASKAALDFPSTSILVDIPKAEDSENTTFWFELFPVINGREGPVFYSSPKATVGQNATGTAPALNKFGFLVESRFNSQRVHDSCQLSVVVTSNGRTHN
jgi:hypothetical protein